MANLLITDRCNRRCSFCFAQSRVGRKERGKQSSNMSRENIRKVMKFMIDSGERQLRLLGGEPTLHPEFIEIVEEGLGNDLFIHVFTNGIMKKEIADFLSKIPDNRITMLCNVSPQANDSDRKIAMRNYALRQFGKVVQVGITLTSPQFDYKYLIDYIKKYKLKKRIRIGIAQPIVGKDNEFLKTSEYRETGKAIIRMVKECIKEDILVGFDCGLTLCMFNEEEIGILMTCSEGFVMHCNPILDVGKGLDIWHCFPLSEVLVSQLEYFKNRNDAVRFYKDMIKPYRSLGCMPECIRCDFLRRGQCTGGCLAHAINSLNRFPPRQARPEEKTL